jgi:hypothetical protein
MAHTACVTVGGTRALCVVVTVILRCRQLLFSRWGQRFLGAINGEEWMEERLIYWVMREETIFTMTMSANASDFIASCQSMT